MSSKIGVGFNLRREGSPPGVSSVKIYAYLCRRIGVFPITKGSISPAAPSLVVLGENASAIIVTLRVGSLSRRETADERPITPAPTTAMDAMFILGNLASSAPSKSRIPSGLR